MIQKSCHAFQRFIQRFRVDSLQVTCTCKTREVKGAVSGFLIILLVFKHNMQMSTFSPTTRMGLSRLHVFLSPTVIRVPFSGLSEISRAHIYF